MEKNLDRPGGSEELGQSLRTRGKGNAVHPVDTNKCVWMMDGAG